MKPYIFKYVFWLVVVLSISTLIGMGVIYNQIEFTEKLIQTLGLVVGGGIGGYGLANNKNKPSE